MLFLIAIARLRLRHTDLSMVWHCLGHDTAFSIIVRGRFCTKKVAQ